MSETKERNCNCNFLQFKRTKKIKKKDLLVVGVLAAGAGTEAAVAADDLGRNFRGEIFPATSSFFFFLSSSSLVMLLMELLGLSCGLKRTKLVRKEEFSNF